MKVRRGEVCDLYQSGLTAADVAERLKVTQATVFYHLHKAGVPLRPYKSSDAVRRKISAARMGKRLNLRWHDLARKMHAAGRTVEDIAIEFDKSINTVWWVLCERTREVTRARIRRNRDKARASLSQIPAGLPSRDFAGPDAGGCLSRSPASSVLVVP